jgi:hypothetical protein
LSRDVEVVGRSVFRKREVHAPYIEEKIDRAMLRVVAQLG